jgi:hypothetical protein
MVADNAMHASFLSCQNGWSVLTENSSSGLQDIKPANSLIDSCDNHNQTLSQPASPNHIKTFAGGAHYGRCQKREGAGPPLLWDASFTLWAAGPLSRRSTSHRSALQHLLWSHTLSCAAMILLVSYFPLFFWVKHVASCWLLCHFPSKGDYFQVE